MFKTMNRIRDRVKERVEEVAERSLIEVGLLGYMMCAFPVVMIIVIVQTYAIVSCEGWGGLVRVILEEVLSVEVWHCPSEQ